MSASVVEQGIAHALVVLSGLVGNGAVVVERGTGRQRGPDATPSLALYRGNSSHTKKATRTAMAVTLDVEVCTTGPDAETTADALWVAAHARLMADPLLAQGGIDCEGTACRNEAGDKPLCSLIARYTFQVFARPGDISTPLQ